MQKKPILLNGAVIVGLFVAGLPALWYLGFPDPRPDGFFGWARSILLLAAPFALGGLAVWNIVQWVSGNPDETRKRFIRRYPLYAFLGWLSCLLLGFFTATQETSW
ncbi:MAG: hypothetical protein EPN26_02305 [Rhodospirillales bacterium]|nr:MAG: hypothetical protein EPN26_02305 [Rhodospirillales bacterium]